MNNQFSDAAKVFEESYKRNFTADELNMIQFTPVDPTNSENNLRIIGTVVSVKGGYSWVEVTGFPKAFLCPGSKYKKIIMVEGLRISFEPSFNAKGSIADKPEEVK